MCSLVPWPDSHLQGFELKDGANTIGRNPSCSLVCPAESVSGLHCVIHLSGIEKVKVEDRSRNGTQLNGTRLEKLKMTEMRPGDIIALAAPGPGTCFRLELREHRGLRRMRAMDVPEVVDELAVVEQKELMQEAPPDLEATKGVEDFKLKPPDSSNAQIRVRAPRSRPLLVLPGHIPPLKRPRPNFDFESDRKEWRFCSPVVPRSYHWPSRTARPQVALDTRVERPSSCCSSLGSAWRLRSTLRRGL